RPRLLGEDRLNRLVLVIARRVTQIDECKRRRHLGVVNAVFSHTNNQRQTKTRLRERAGLVGDNNLNVCQRQLNQLLTVYSLTSLRTPSIPVTSTHSIVGTLTRTTSTMRSRTSNPCRRSICSSSTV